MATRLCRPDKITGNDIMRCGTGNPDHRNAIEKRKGGYQYLNASTKGNNQHQHLQNPGQGEKCVDHTHQHLIEAPTNKPEKNADKAPPDHRQRCGDSCDKQGFASTHQGP